MSAPASAPDPTPAPDLASLIAERHGATTAEHPLVTFVNPFSYLKLRRVPDLVAQFDQIHFDGILLVVLARILGIRTERRSFDYTSLAPEVFDRAVDDDTSVLLIGGRPGDASKAAAFILGRHPRLQILDALSGYHDDAADYERTIQRVCHLNPGIVVASMGTPLQEGFLIDLRAAGWTGAGFTCGAFFQQVSSSGLDYYPPWADRLNLRWLYRMLREPEVRKRYLITYPYAITLIVRDFLRVRAAQNADQAMDGYAPAESEEAASGRDAQREGRME